MELLRRARFAPIVLALGVVVVAAVALIVGWPIRGPEPSEPTTPSASTSPRDVPSRTPSTTALVAEGDEARIDAVDAAGGWGTITITRGPDIGGFPRSPVADDVFLIRLEIAYEYERAPGSDFGIDDWSLAADDGRPIGGVFDPPVPDDPAYPAEGISMGMMPGATVIDPRMGGSAYFEVPRAAANEKLVLLYRPAGFAEAVATLIVREPGEPPAPVPAATPPPTPAPLDYVDRDLPFTIIASAKADALFASPDTCTNPVASYTVTFPDDWYTNTAIGDVPACSWFSPTFFEVADPAIMPDEIAIAVTSFVGGIGFVHQPVYTLTEQLDIEGRTASRTEELGGFGVDGFIPRSRFTYQYTIWVDDDYLGLKVVATTSNQMAGDYELNKAVLDRIMASISFGNR